MTATRGTGSCLSAAKQRLLAERRQNGAGAHRDFPAVPRRGAGAAVKATHEQQALWFLDRYLGAGANSAYNLYHALRLRGGLDADLLQECLRQIVARHDALRTTFGAATEVDDADRAGGLLLHVAPPPLPSMFTLPVHNAEAADVIATVLDEALIPFDLATGPLFRPSLFRLGDRDHVLLLSAHHAVFDGASVELVVAELARLYAAGAAGRDDTLALPPIEFADWASYTHSEEHRAAVAERLEAAFKRLHDAPELLNLPTDHPRGAQPSTEGGTVSIRLDAATASALRELCRSEGVTLFTAVMAVYQLLLSRWSGQDDICVGMAVTRRGRAELAEVVGYLVATAVVRTQVDEELTFRELLARVTDSVLAGRADADVPFEQVVARLRPGRTSAHNPVFQAFLDVAAVDLVAETGAGLWPEGITAEPLLLPVREEKFDLSLSVIDRAEGMSAELNYRRNLFRTATAARLLDQLVALMDGLTKSPDIPVADVSALSQAETQRWLADGSGAAVALPDTTLPGALAAATARSPDSVAVRAGDVDLTYAELDRGATVLAQRLLGFGAGPGRTVAVAVPRSLDLAVALGAVLRAGAAYLPLDLDHPAERQRFMLDDARPVCLLTTSALAPAFVGVGVPCLEIETQKAGTAPEPEIAKRRLPTPHVLDAAYVIYTSGSTGRPKGVAVPHRGIVNRLRWMQHAYPLAQGERILQKTPITFDVSVWELFWPLLEGATLVFAPPGAHRDPLKLAQLVADERITTMHFVPSMLRVFLDEPEVVRTRKYLRRVVCSGEELPASTVARFAEVLPDVELHNLYGPTEASVDVTAWKCGPNDAITAPPIGHPVWNTCIRVLDQRLRPVPVGVAGELYLSGVQLALGYHRRPSLTAERFLPDPWGAPGSRMYRTGDVVRQRQDGALAFLGRADRQVKLRGHRVELGEIEQVLQANSSVADAVVLVRQDRLGVAQLVAYVTSIPGLPLPEAPVLLAHARAVLPAVMVPEAVVVLEAFPLTTSGKLDRQALPAPAAAMSSAKQRLIAGRRRRPVAEQRPNSVPGHATTILCDLFARLLGFDTVGPDDDFFRLGGDSIGSIRLVSLARRAGLGFSERMVFEHRTPRLLAAAAEALIPQPGPDAGPDEGTGVIPLTPIMRWWREGGGPTIGFHQSVLLDLPPGTGEQTIVELLRALADRHDLLRARLTTDVEGQEVLTVPPAPTVDAASWLTRVDARELDDERSFVTSVADGAARRLDPARGLVDAVWIDRGHGRRGRLLLAVHHLAVDGVSWRVLLDDVAAAWDDGAAGRPVRPPEVGTSFRTWAHHLVREACEPARMAELDVWVRALTAPEPSFGSALDPTSDTAGSSLELVHELETEHADPLLGAVPDRFRAGVDHVLLCALALAVRAWRDQRGTPSSLFRVMVEGHGRHHLRSDFDLSRTVGWFTVRYPAVLDLTALDTLTTPLFGPAASAALRAVKEQLGRLPDGGLGYGLLRYLSPVTRQTLAALPEPTVAFNYLGRFRAGDATGQGDGVHLAEDAHALDGGIAAATPLTSALDVTAIAWEHPRGVRLRTTFSWAPRLLEEGCVRELVDLWMAALTALAGLAGDTDAGAGRARASDVFLDIDQDELDALQREIESDWGPG